LRDDPEPARQGRYAPIVGRIQGPVRPDRRRGQVVARVYALGADGGVKWHTDTGSPGFQQMPAIGGDGTVYVAADKIYAIGP